nr:mlo-like protein 2 [Quercus suber]
MVGKDIPKPGESERSVEHTPTWAVAVVCLVLVVISLFLEHIIHIIGKVSLSIYLNIRLDPQRFRFTRDTSFGRRHLNFWSKSPISLWMVCFFQQFFTSVNKAHSAPKSETEFDFQKYISRSLEKDFKVVVGISPIIWFFALLFLLSNTYGWHSYLWLPFLPLIIILMVGTKLLVIITQMGLRIQEIGDVAQFGLSNCFYSRTTDIVIRISMGLIIQVVCSYVTLPLYALVTQVRYCITPIGHMA